jgi:hypothetical protein
MYRFEVWVNKTISVGDLEELKQYLKENLGGSIEDKLIKV